MSKLDEEEKVVLYQALANRVVVDFYAILEEEVEVYLAEHPVRETGAWSDDWDLSVEHDLDFCEYMDVVVTFTIGMSVVVNGNGDKEPTSDTEGIQVCAHDSKRSMRKEIRLAIERVYKLMAAEFAAARDAKEAACPSSS